MLIYQLIITTVLCIPFSIGVWNYFRFARIVRGERPRLAPRISVLVPARNEERSILDCIASLLHQDYPDYEVIVLDDNSDDGTNEILSRLKQERSDLTVILGAPLPAGWVGKNWACHQLSRAASGELFIFTDADTVHRPESISACAAFAEQTGAGFFSGVPHQKLGTFWEQIIVPMIQFLYFAYLPNDWIRRFRNPKLSAANGQLLCITRNAYNRIGGHEAVKNQLVEDVKLGQLAKEKGIRTALATAVDTVSCRMYTSLHEIIGGFSKNLFPGFGYSLPIMVGFVISTFLLYIAPLGFLLASLATATFSLSLFWLPLLHLSMAGIIRLLIARRFHMSFSHFFYHPLSSAMAIIIAANSVKWAFSKTGASWKGRTYEKPATRSRT